MGPRFGVNGCINLNYTYKFNSHLAKKIIFSTITTKWLMPIIAACFENRAKEDALSGTSHFLRM